MGAFFRVSIGIPLQNQYLGAANQPTMLYSRLAFLYCLFVTVQLSAQSSYLTRFVITGPYNEVHQIQLDSALATAPGVVIHRTTLTTRNALLLTHDFEPSPNDISDLTQALGLSFKCMQIEPYTNQLLTPLNMRDCDRIDLADENQVSGRSGPCCSAHAGTGCLDFGCQTAICNLDAFCCNSSWDGLCAGAAIDNANLGGACAGVTDCPGGSGGGGGSGPCCQAGGNGSPGCENAACQTAICNLDAFCCNNTWDGICAGMAVDNANANGPCAGVSDCPGSSGGGSGPCCLSVGNGSPGCENGPCQTAVCNADPFCCSVIWDAFCATEAFDNALNGGACSGISDCPTGNDGGPVTAGDCVNAINVCTDLNFAVDPNGFGNINEICNCCTSNPCTNPASTNSGCLLAGELNSTWMVINIQTGGVLEFSFGNQIGNNCYDWIMWPYDGNACNQILNNSLPPVRCNWNFPCDSYTGVGSPPPPGGNAGNFEPSLNVNAGDQFVVCFSNYSSAITSVPLQFGGTAEVSCTPLPVELINFNGKAQNNDVLLRWETATEINNDVYTLKTSIDGIHFSNIAEVKGAGNSTTPSAYSHLHINPPSGWNYYRLFQRDYNGNDKLIGEAAVEFKSEPWHVFPNPSAGQWYVEHPGASENLLYRMVNLHGAEVPVVVESQGGLLGIRMRQPMPGTYFLLVEDSRGNLMQRLKLIAL